MRRGLKIIAVLLVLAVTLQRGCVFAHDMGTISGIGIDYASWDKEAPPSAVMPTPEPTPTSTPTPEPTPQRPTKFKEVEIARASTTYGTYAAQANRNNNMALAAKAIDYTVIDNGDSFSFNNVVGPRTAARGYKEATIFVGDEKGTGPRRRYLPGVVDRLYGCQKGAAQDFERYPHTIPVTYCSREDEATVAWGYLDFRFRNNTGDPIRLEASCSGGVVRVIIYQRVPVYD